MGRVWSFLIATIVIIILVNIAVEAIRLYLPVIGFILVCLGAYFLFRFLVSRRRS